MDAVLDLPEPIRTAPLYSLGASWSRFLTIRNTLTDTAVALARMKDMPKGRFPITVCSISDMISKALLLALRRSLKLWYRSRKAARSAPPDRRKSPSLPRPGGGVS